MIGKKKKKRAGWYSTKGYAHFDVPLDFGRALALVSDRAAVATHSFKPFIGFTDKKRRFGVKSGANVVSWKERELKYCSHVDGAIHAFYAKQLNNKYDELLSRQRFSDSVIGYRAGIGTNIDFAADAFTDIRLRGDCLALCLDLSSFFDSIDHAVLKRNLKTVLGVTELSPDWYAVYRSMTKFAWVEIDSLIARLGLNEKALPWPICSPSEFRTRVRGRKSDGNSIIISHQKSYGIPQGSPLSAVLSNVYMLNFDQMMHEGLSILGGSYRRYSDDILVIAEQGDEGPVREVLTKALNSLGPSISTNEEKTERCCFAISSSGELVADHPLTYLGFTFDGKRVRLRDRTLSRYYRRMTYATRSVASATKKASAITPFKRKLLRDFTHLGRKNLYQYAKSAAKKMGDATPKRQLRRHMQILERKLRPGGK